MKIIIDISRRSAEALAVAISNHAHSMAISFQEFSGRKPESLTEEEQKTMRAHGYHAIALQSAKVQVKRQAGLK